MRLLVLLCVLYLPVLSAGAGMAQAAAPQTSAVSRTASVHEAPKTTVVDINPELPLLLAESSSGLDESRRQALAAALERSWNTPALRHAIVVFDDKAGSLSVLLSAALSKEVNAEKSAQLLKTALKSAGAGAKLSAVMEAFAQALARESAAGKSVGLTAGAAPNNPGSSTRDPRLQVVSTSATPQPPSVAFAAGNQAPSAGTQPRDARESLLTGATAEVPVPGQAAQQQSDRDSEAPARDATASEPTPAGRELVLARSPAADPTRTAPPLVLPSGQNATPSHSESPLPQALVWLPWAGCVALALVCLALVFRRKAPAARDSGWAGVVAQQGASFATEGASEGAGTGNGAPVGSVGRDGKRSKPKKVQSPASPSHPAAGSHTLLSEPLLETVSVQPDIDLAYLPATNSSLNKDSLSQAAQALRQRVSSRRKEAAEIRAYSPTLLIKPPR